MERPYTVVGGVGTWLATDRILIEIDEKINREKLKADLLKSLDEQLAETELHLKRASAAKIDFIKNKMNKVVFIPLRDGYSQN